MGLGGYLAARSDAEHYHHERDREEFEIREKTDVEIQEVGDILKSYGLTAAQSRSVAVALSKKPREWIDFMMRFELGLEEPDPKRALTSALTIGGSYIAGGLIPLAPYMLIPSTATALLVSLGVTMAALAVFGYVKGSFTGARPLRSAIQTVLIGGLAAGVAFLIARAI